MAALQETPILIVGGGPIGLGFALDLAWRGQRCLLVEKTDGSIRHSKMGGIAYRTMEFCRRWGIVEEVEQAGFPVTFSGSQVFCTSLTGLHIATSHYPSIRDQDLTPYSPEKHRRLPQIFFNPMMARIVARTKQVEQQYMTELLSLEQDETGVTATVRDLKTGDEPLIRARYVVGCDGAGSTIRRLMGVKMAGEPVLSYSTGIYLTVSNLFDQHRLPIGERYNFVGPEGLWASMVTVDGDARWRLTLNGSKERIEAEDFDADYWVRRAFGSDDIKYEITDILPWRRGQLVAERYRNGRIFLAGDSAHIMGPNGGYGMNTGMQDAVDLSWKLDATLRGWAGDHLLDSYDAERRPIGRRNVDAAANNFHRSTAKPDPRLAAELFDEGVKGDKVRRILGERLQVETRAQWERLGVLLGYRYENSPICVADGTPAPPDDPVDYVPTSRPGHRAPHAWLGRDRSILDLFGKGFVLLRFADIDVSSLVAAFEGRKVPLTVHTFDEPELAELYERNLVLVRPDDHVAWRGQEVPADPVALVDIVRGSVAANDIVGQTGGWRRTVR